MLKGAVVLGLEDTGSRMSRLGKGELLYDELLSVDEVLRRVDAVTPGDGPQVAGELLARPDVAGGDRRRSTTSDFAGAFG